eukprot:Opistho-1_new@37536
MRQRHGGHGGRIGEGKEVLQPASGAAGSSGVPCGRLGRAQQAVWRVERGRRIGRHRDIARQGPCEQQRRCRHRQLGGIVRGVTQLEHQVEHIIRKPIREGFRVLVSLDQHFCRIRCGSHEMTDADGGEAVGGEQQGDDKGAKPAGHGSIVPSRVGAAGLVVRGGAQSARRAAESSDPSTPPVPGSAGVPMSPASRPRTCLASTAMKAAVAGLGGRRKSVTLTICRVSRGDATAWAWSRPCSSSLRTAMLGSRVQKSLSCTSLTMAPMESISTLGARFTSSACAKLSMMP